MNARRLVAVLLALAAPLGAAFSQSSAASPERWSLRADNDAFDFWMQPFNRPDDEYTSGVHIDYDGGGAPWWSRSLRARPTCTLATTTCVTQRVEIGQDIYTPNVDVTTGLAPANSRPNAGWLYVSQTARTLAPTRSDELSFTLGVTGPPSLARYTQQLAHRADPAFNRPTDWSRQIGFEPGVIGRYELRDRTFAAGGDSFGADFIPRVAASAGNVLTSADAGFDARIGRHLSHPWLPSRAGGVEVDLLAGATGSAVARNLFLDGNTFRPSPRVGHEPFAANGNIGILIRYRSLDFTYKAESDSRSWHGGPAWHPWSSLVLGVTARSGS